MEFSSQHQKPGFSRVKKTQKRNWIAVALNALLWPGVGQIYLGQRWKGLFFAVAEFTLFSGALVRYMSMMFALINTMPYSNTRKAFPLMIETWQKDQEVLLPMIIAVILIWVLAIWDVALTLRHQNPSLYE